MIDAKELRKYNNVYDKNGNVASVFTIGCESVRLSTNTYKAESHNINDIAPIPLTEEMLLKCGFEKNDNTMMSDSFYKIEVGSSLLNINPNNGVVWITRDDNIFNNPALVIYLHQLQNLYFALTGQELNVEL